VREREFCELRASTALFEVRRTFVSLLQDLLRRTVGQKEAARSAHASRAGYAAVPSMMTYGDPVPMIALRWNTDSA
jgi:hypothetical protein